MAFGLDGGASKESNIEDDMGSAIGLGAFCLGGAVSNESNMDSSLAVVEKFCTQFDPDDVLPLDDRRFWPFSSSSYDEFAISCATRMDGISMPHRLRALETISNEDHKTRFSGLSTFSKDGLVQKLITALVLVTTEMKDVSSGLI